MISNCPTFGPTVVELLIHQFSFQERFLDLMKDGCFKFKLRGVGTSLFVCNDGVIEEVNFLAGQFCHKRKLLSRQSTKAIQSISYKNNKNRLIKTLT